MVLQHLVWDIERSSRNGMCLWVSKRLDGILDEDNILIRAASLVLSYLLELRALQSRFLLMIGIGTNASRSTLH